uniref:Integrase catalytic domain-containing protein n=1 Tax=Cacopsylla melanoneura TaxID=428564 RepID=A0A8D8YNP1_9HEMI
MRYLFWLFFILGGVATMAPTISEKIKCAVSNRERYFQKIQAIFDLIKVPAKQAEFLVRCSNLEDAYSKFEVQTELINLLNEQVDDSTEVVLTLPGSKALDDIYYTVKAHWASIRQAEAASSSQTAQAEAPAPVAHIPRAKLPTINVPTFGGDISEFLSWKSLFDELVHRSDNLTDIQKFSYLRSYLCGSALKCIDTIGFTSANYTLAYKSLSDRFSKKRTLASTLMNKLLEFKPLQTDTISGLRSFIDDFYVVVESIKSLTINNLDEFILVHLGLRILDPVSSMEFERESVNTQFPTFAQLVKFVKNKANILEQTAETQVSRPSSGFPSYSSKPSSGFPSSPSKPRRFEPKPKVSLVGAHQQVNKHWKDSNVKCYVCNKGPHRLTQCEKFQGLDSSKRFTVVKEMKLCFSCLSSTHAASDCKSIYRCRTCGSDRHHSMLHSSSSNKMSTQVDQHMPVSKADVAISGHLLSSSTVLLGTAVVRIQDIAGQWVPVRCIIDMGSQVSIISERLANGLRLPRKHSSLKVAGVGAASCVTTKGKLLCKVLPSSKTMLSDSHHHRYPLDIEAVIMPQITSTLPHQLSSDILKRFQHLNLADTTYYHNDSQLTSIELLLGAEYYSDIILHSLPIISGSPSAVPSIFGYLLLGKALVESSSDQCSSSLFISTIDDDVSTQLQKFWSLEEIVPSSPIISKEDQKCEDHFISTHSRDPTGRYIVRLPFRDDCDSLGSNRGKALRLFNSLERRLDNNSDMKKLYAENLQTYLDLDHMEIAPTQADYYLSHHGVYREHSSTTRLRVVFNPNLTSTTGKTLSQVLLTGPKLQFDIQDILVLFRLNPVALCCDIQAMYRCILLAPEDRIYQHILWRNDKSDDLIEYELKTVTFGLGPSPFLAQRVIKQLAIDEKEKYPCASQVLLESIYVDDIVTGSDSISSARFLRDQLVALLKCGGFSLRKWMCSHPEVLSDLSSDLCETPNNLGSTESFKILGIQWSPPTDSFIYSISIDPTNQPTTKRQVLSLIASIYDVNGLLSPVTIYMKIFMQQIWLHKDITWDTPLPSDLQKRWDTLISEIHLLSKIKIPRYMLHPKYLSVDIVGFADASSAAFAAVVFLRVVRGDGLVDTHLVRAKTRVAPLKVQTINKLELCAAVLLAQVCHSLAFLHQKLRISNTYLFSDSETVLAWLKIQPHCLKTFVANRVVKILELSDPTQWRYVSTKENSADVASRGQLPSQLLENQLWFCGPSFLQLDPSQWPLSKVNVPNNSLPEMKLAEPIILTVQSVVSSDLIKVIERFSSLSKLQQVIGYVLRFINNVRYPNRRVTGARLSIKELDSSLQTCLKISQNVYLSEEIKLVRKGDECSSHLHSLSPLLNSAGLLVVGGRLANAAIPEYAKHPILLSKQCHLTWLIINMYHVLTLHGGPKIVQALVQRRYWIVNGRNVIRSIIFKCVSCAKIKARTYQPIMADLPKSRVSQGRPFINVGVDFAGPFSYKTGPRRNSPVDKCYMALFICMATKCVHLEVVSSLSTPAFIASLDRFISRRGLPKIIFSDNGTNFRGASSYLQDVQRFLRNSSSEITHYLLTHEVTWSFIPVNSPSWGGLWESNIKCAKTHLKQVLHGQSLNFESYSSIFSRVESCLNSRPLCSVSSSPNDGIDYLSPGHFLIGAPLLARPDHEEADYDHMSINRRWRLISQATFSFWNRWSRSYINTLIQRRKWTKPCPPMQVGDIVLIQTNSTPPQSWPLGRVVSLHPGQDDQVVRLVKVKTQQGEILRPVAKLVPLPVDH